MIVLDTTVLLYAVGGDHPLAAPCARLLETVRSGGLDASTTPEVIQEFVHLRARRRTREDAAALGRSYAEGLSPLLHVGEDDLLRGLRIFERHDGLGASDAVLAAVAIGRDARALVSADRAFGSVRGVPFIDVAAPDLDELLAGD